MCRSLLEPFPREISMNYRIVSGTSLAVAARAGHEWRIGHPRLRQKSGCRVHGDQCLQGTKRLQDCEQRVQGPEFLQGPWMAASQVGESLRGERRHRRLIDYQAGGRLYRTEVSVACLGSGRDKRHLQWPARPRLPRTRARSAILFCEDNRMERPPSLGSAWVNGRNTTGRSSRERRGSTGSK